jgi:hypothetical protein
MSKDGRTYAIVKWNPGIERTTFAKLRGQGVLQTSFDTARVSPDGKSAILCWRGTQPADLAGLTLWTGTHAEMLAYLSTNRAAWERRGTMLAAGAALSDGQQKTATGGFPWAWVSGGAMLAAAAAAYFLAQ